MLNIIFSLIALPYAPNALEPVISRETIEYHYGKHLQTYVDNLHNLYFTQFKPYEDPKFEPLNPKSEEIVPPAGKEILKAIARDFGSFEAFQAEFEQKGTTLFGSGWVWLAADKDGKLVITQEPNAGNPVTKGLKPLLTMDVWEHAYYIDYRNRRAAHLHSLWQIIDWSEINRRYTN